MSEKQDLALFIEHWQEMSGTELDVALGLTSATSSTEPFFPLSFFEASRSKRALPMTSKSLRKPDYAALLSAVRSTLPANPGDLLWLIDQFLEEYFAQGGEIDLASGSEHRDSVYQLISSFCSKALYKHHPQLQTLKAMTNIVEKGATERLIGTNALTFAFEVLREPFTKRKKTLVLKVDGKRQDSSRFVATIGTAIPKHTIRPWDEPKLEYEVEVLDDFTDDEGQTHKRGREEDSEDDAGSSSYKIAKTGKSEGQDVGEGLGSSDDDML
jgi:hypothetical protein